MVKLGQAFSDSIIKMTKRRSATPPPPIRGWGARITFLYFILIVIFSVLFLRLFHLTIVSGAKNRELSEENRIRSSVIHAPRGTIKDRRGVPLVRNIPAYRVSPPCEVGKTCGVEFLTEEEWKEKGYSKEKYYSEHDYLREYEYPQETAHVLGFLGEISQEELKNPYYAYQDFEPGDRLGRMGIEESFNPELKGINGRELIEVDSSGVKVRTLGKIDAKPGRDLTLSLDADLQQVAYQAMGGYTGAVVVTKPATGEILALISTPSFNPNLIHQGITRSEYEKLFKSEAKPLFNRAISGVYPPGSTFKIVSSIAGLESKAVSGTTLFEDTGILTIGTFSFGNWNFIQNGKKDGMVDIVKGIARSNDIYFYHLGEKTGIETLAHWGKELGIGQKTGLELSGEAEGVMPDPEWRKKVRGGGWYLGDTYHVSIGQGDLQTTPLQVNLWTNAIAANGKLCKPTLHKTDKGTCRDLHLSEDTVILVREGMRRACMEGSDTTYRGTGWPLFNFSVVQEKFENGNGERRQKSVPVACKTGTAEFGDPENKTHAWFSVFAPLPGEKSNSVITGEPEISVTVLLEKGGEGSNVAAPIAKKILEEWFKR